ncbi:MAG: hypothetical protein DMG82_05390 [Acidobacteria bacterium]|nr:MAG: hypothetical protein DMG82_05390 [Acidobacteriota bacterium]PYX41090.1 MAG: hypothetical protein DMG83_24770 [Acidobacteriota bacterium]
MPVVAAVAFPVFIFLLPLLMFLLLVPGYLSADEVRLLRVLFPFLMPFSSVLWFIVAHRLVPHRRSSYLHQLFVFLATAIFMFLMIRLGIYRIG